MNISAIDKKFNRDRIEFQHNAISFNIWQCCLNCENWNKKDKNCRLFKAIPPVEVLVIGCEEYINDIPF